MPHLVATALTGAALALLPAVPATAATSTVTIAAPSTPAPPAGASAQAGRGTALRLTLTFPEQNASGSRTVTLACDPAGGSHPHATQACADLDRSRGRFEHEPDGRACTLIYSPVVARAEGSWHGRPARFRREFPNDCVMRAHTDSVFTF